MCIFGVSASPSNTVRSWITNYGTTSSTARRKPYSTRLQFSRRSDGCSLSFRVCAHSVAVWTGACSAWIWRDLETECRQSSCFSVPRSVGEGASHRHSAGLVCSRATENFPFSPSEIQPNANNAGLLLKGGKRGISPLRKFRSPFQIVSERLGRERGISPFQIYFGAHFQSIRYSDSIAIVNQILVINQRCWR